MHLNSFFYSLYLVNCPDDDSDSSRNMSVMNNAIITLHRHAFVGLIA